MGRSALLAAVVQKAVGIWAGLRMQEKVRDEPLSADTAVYTHKLVASDQLKKNRHQF